MKIIPELFLILGFLWGSNDAKAYVGQDLLSGREIQFPGTKSKATVVVFLSAKCPCSASHEKSLKALYETYSKEGFQFVGVHSNQDEPEVMGLAHFRESKLPFPVLKDPGAKLADEFKALKTPHVFVLKDQEILFQGGVDDSAEAANAKKNFLADALLSLKLGKKIETTRARALGCAIKR